MASSPSPKKKVTRYGPVKQCDIKFGTEERFQWQKSKYVSDIVYALPDTSIAKSIIFSSSLRGGMDIPRSSTGPGSYNPGECYDFMSEYVARKGNRFGAAARESMAMKTPSPGAVYNIDGCYTMGPEKNKGISFNCDQRPPLYGSGAGSNADMVFPKLPTGPKITIAGRWKEKTLNKPGPGAIYDVLKFRVNSTPSYSFGKGKGNRFKEVQMLKDIEC